MDYKQLKLLYEQMYNLAIETQSAIQTEAFENIQPITAKKDKLLSHIALIKKEHGNDVSLPRELQDTIEKVKVLEAANIQKLTELKNDLKTEMDKVSQGSKIMAAYAPIDNEVAAIVDVTE